MRAWLALVQHDLVKRLLWPARDRRDMGGTAAPGELEPRLVDDEGAPITPEAQWNRLRAEAPAGAPPDLLDRFGEEVRRAAAAARAGDLDGVLALDGAFRAFSQALTKDK